jgi:hypothetical protein
MSEPNTRRFWQIHLSTALVLTIISGGFIWENTQKRRSIIEQDRTGPKPTSYRVADVKGWPLILTVVNEEGSESLRVVPWLGFIINGSFLVFLLAIAAASCELLMQRREGRKP